MTAVDTSSQLRVVTELERRLFERGVQTYVLDGDNIRTGLCRDLGFTDSDRSENVHRVGEVAALFADAGLVAIAAFISPYRADREEARRAAGIDFHEIYVKADPALCEARDPKGHYAKARAGTLPGFTGLNVAYEEPLAPDLVVDTAALSMRRCRRARARLHHGANRFRTRSRGFDLAVNYRAAHTVNTLCMARAAKRSFRDLFPAHRWRPRVGGLLAAPTAP